MDQNQLAKNLEDAVLDSLPEEAIERLAAISDKENFSRKEVTEVLNEYGININEMAKNLVDEEGNNNEL